MLGNNEQPTAFDFDEEFSRAGLLCNFLNKVNNEENIDMQTLQREIVLQNCVGLICAEITEKASEASIAQMDGVYVHLKLLYNDKTFGYMYSLL